MSHIWLTCPTCNKYVRLKPWLGTLHFCLSPEERAAKAQANYYIQAQQRFMAEMSNPYRCWPLAEPLAGQEKAAPKDGSN